MSTYVWHWEQTACLFTQGCCVAVGKAFVLPNSEERPSITFVPVALYDATIVLQYLPVSLGGDTWWTVKGRGGAG